MKNDIQYGEYYDSGGSIDKGRIMKVLRNSSFKFIRNDGQLDNSVGYYAKTGMASYFFTKGKIVFSFLRKKESEQEAKLNKFDRISRISSLQDRIYERLVFSMEFKGSNRSVEIEGLDECEDTVNYFRGKDPKKWCTKVPCFERIIYRNLYPSIDLVCRFKDGTLKYDFIVNPGASQKDISLAYSGIEGLDIDGGGNLVIKTLMGDFFNGKPDSYQEIKGKKIDVGAEFELRGRAASESIFGFKINKRCNPNYPIIIDPDIIYSSYLGGGGVDDGFGIAVDQNGCAYITGQTTSLDFPIKNGFDTNLSGPIDAFVTKISRIPTIVYSSYLGGSGEDFGEGIAADQNGNAYITGVTSSDDFPTVNAFQNNRNGAANDAFVTKISPSGTIVYSSYLGGSGSDSGVGIAVDESGNAYITGVTRSTDFPRVNAFDTTLGGEEDAFVTKISPAPAIVYSSYLGGSSFDVGLGIAVDKNGNAYITGDTLSDDFPTVNAFDNTRSVFDAFITKISSAPAIVYSSFLGGSGSDFGNSVAVDQNGNAYITGTTDSRDFPAVNAFQNNFGGGDRDAFITKVSPTPAIVYSSYLGGSGNDDGNSVAVDQNGNAYIAGFTNSTNFPTVNAFDNNLSGPDDGFITKISPVPAIVYSSYLGGNGDDEGLAVAVDRSGNAYVTGYTTSTDFPTVNAFQKMYGGEEDAFVTKIEAVGQRPECILTYKVFDSQKQRKCSIVFIPAPYKDCSEYNLTDMTFENGIIDEKTLTITPVPSSPDYKCVKFMFKIPCISKYTDFRTGKIIKKAGCLTDIWVESVLYMPEYRNELRFRVIIETLTKLLNKPQKVHGGFKVKIGLFYVVKSIARVQLEVISNGYCVPLEDCNIPKKDKCCDFLDPAVTPFPPLYPKQQ